MNIGYINSVRFGLIWLVFNFLNRKPNQIDQFFGEKKKQTKFFVLNRFLIFSVWFCGKFWFDSVMNTLISLLLGNTSYENENNK